MTKKLSRVLCTVLAIAILTSVQIPLANAATTTFTDVPTDAWFYDAVTTCANKGIVSGMGDGRFAPSDNLTYAHIFSMLSNAFYKSEEAAYERNNVTDVDKTFDGNTPWWGYYAYFLDDNRLLKDTNVKITFLSSVNSNISRYEMVQIVRNVLTDKNVTVSQSVIDNAKSAITDWAKVPAKYQDAVATGYGLGIITGFDDHSFGGTSVLTRAQACVIFNKLDDVIANGAGGGTTDPGPVDPQPPQPPVSDEKDIIVSADKNGYGYYVGDNQFGTGTLNNGKPITEDNVLALLKKAEGIWPTGTTWKASGANNHWYESSGSVVNGILLSKHNVSPMYGCGGFAAMVSDYLFGKSNNPAHQVTNVADIRPGDIIIHKSNGEVYHVSVAVSSPIKDGDFAGRVYLAGGNESNQIVWPASNSTPWSEAVSKFYDPTYTWEAWSRYPSGGGTTEPGPVAPNPPASTGEIKVTENNGAYTVADNQFGTGTLNNGLPITEANVLALLKKAEGIWPDGLKWTYSGTANNHWYESAGSVVNGVLLNGYNQSTMYACGGFAAMVSDYLFGKSNNPAHQVTNINDIRPGDIIVHFSNGKVDHVVIATSSPIKSGDYAGRVYTADGNNSAQVNWPKDNTAPWSVTVSQFFDPTYTWEAWSRYPSGGGTTEPEQPKPPQPPVSGEKDIIVSTASNGRGYYVGDNQFATGTLNNGKPITEANVLALIEAAKKIWPTGTKWDDDKLATYYYETSGSVVNGIMKGRVNSNYGCGGFAAMVSDYVFGKNNNPVHRVTDPMAIRPGDIIIILDNGKVNHVSFVVTGSIKEGDFYGRVITADGNYDDVGIDWTSTPVSEALHKFFDPTITWEVWSRYPA